MAWPTYMHERKKNNVWGRNCPQALSPLAGSCSRNPPKGNDLPFLHKNLPNCLLEMRSIISNSQTRVFKGSRPVKSVKSAKTQKKKTYSHLIYVHKLYRGKLPCASWATLGSGLWPRGMAWPSTVGVRGLELLPDALQRSLAFTLTTHSVVPRLTASTSLESL